MAREQRTAPLEADRTMFGAELARLRYANGYTQRELAKAVSEVAGRNVSTGALGQWEQGKWWPTFEFIRALEEVLQPPSTLAALAGLPPVRMIEVMRRLDTLEERLRKLESHETGQS